MKLLKWFVLGISIWGLSLLWLEVNLWLTPAVMTILALGLVVFLGAYFLGQQFGQPAGANKCLTMPSTDSTRTTRVGQVKGHHSRPTLPLKTSQTQKLHSRPTRPMSVS